MSFELLFVFSIQSCPITSTINLKEIQECVGYHINLSALANAPTSFRLLNNPGLGPGSQEFEVATNGEANIRADVERSMRIMSGVKPSGCTPLTEHVWDINSTIDALKGSLQAEGKRVVIVIATDGLPTNSLGETNEYVKEQFVQSLQALEGLPVWLVIRLFTDEEKVVVSTCIYIYNMYLYLQYVLLY